MIGFEQFLKNSNFDRLPSGGAGRRQGAPEFFFFGDHVGNENLGKVTKFGYHTITSVDMPETNESVVGHFDTPSLTLSYANELILCTGRLNSIFQFF